MYAPITHLKKPDSTLIFLYIFFYPGLAGEGNRPTAEQIELRLIQSLDDIRNPNITFKAQQVAN